jgi:putative DNA primase/helicase
MNDAGGFAPRRRRYRPPGPPITLPAWARGEAVPTQKELEEACWRWPLLDETGQPMLSADGVVQMVVGNPKPPFDVTMIASGYQRLMKQQLAEARAAKRREEAAKRSAAAMQEEAMDKPLRPKAAGVISIRAPYDTARLFQNGLATPLHHHRGSFFEWSGCAWPEADEAMLRARLYAFLDQCQSKDAKGDLRPVKPTAQMVGGVLDALRAAAQLDASVAPPAWLDGATGPPAREIVACANGLLHLPTARLLPHRPSFFNHNALDFAYQPKAPKPSRWLEFLRQLWPTDDEAVEALQEFFGYCLTADTRQQKAFALIGPKRSGKGTIARVLTALIGAHNCVAPTLAGLGTNFGLAPLIGKRVAIISDARLSGRADQHAIAERLLSITGEDGITVDRKYASAWTGQLQTRFLIVSNELFRLADASGALASRFILLILTESFYGREDQGLTAELLIELPGILNWAVAGWARLTKFGRFKQPASAKEAMEQLEDLASPIGAFVRERCDIGAAHNVGIEAVFGAWRSWCEAQGRDRAGSVQSFGRDLRAAVPALKTAQAREGEGRVRKYQGLRVDSDARCNPVDDSIGSSTKSRVSHSEPPPSARFPGDKDGSARRNIEPLQ